tara:strand:- start:330 stop:557 length:228 start_codon:yes stop_codon:yes gene_type:complete
MEEKLNKILEQFLYEISDIDSEIDHIYTDNLMNFYTGVEYEYHQVNSSAFEQEEIEVPTKRLLNLRKKLEQILNN